MTASASSSNRGWFVTLSALGINLILGALYAWSVMGKALVMQRHWTKTQAALPFAVATAAFAVMMIFAGRMQDRIGPRKVAAFGGLIFGLALASSAWAQSPGMMMLSFGVLGGLGMGLGYSATTPPAVKWFPKAKRGLITGIVVSGVGLAAVYMSPLTQYLLGRTSIERTFLILGCGAVLVVCILSMFLVDPPAGFEVPTSVQTAGPVKPGRELDWPDMLKTPAFYLLWGMFVLTASAGLMIISNVAIIAKEQAHWENGFLPVMTLAVFNTLGRVMSGFLSDRMGRTRTMILVFVLQAGNMLLFAHYCTPNLLLLGSALTGLCYGALFALMPAATADFYGVKHLGVNYGFVFSAFGVAGVLGSLLGGKVRDLLGSYSVAYIACAVMLLVAVGLALITRALKDTSVA